MKAAVGANHTQHGRSTFPHAGPEWMPLTPPAPTQQVPWEYSLAVLSHHFDRSVLISNRNAISEQKVPAKPCRESKSLSQGMLFTCSSGLSPHPKGTPYSHTHTYHTHAYTHTHWQSHWCTHSYETTLMHTGAHTCTRTHIGTHSCTHTHPPHTHTLAHTPTPPCISGTALGTWTQSGALPGITLELA